MKLVKIDFRRFPMTFILFGANTIAFVAASTLGLLQHSYPTVWSWIWINKLVYPILGAMGALTHDVWAQPWRFLTFFFLHIGLLHYALNMHALVRYRHVERHYGSAGYLTIYLLGGLGSGLAATITFLILRNACLVGASGALYAIVAADAMTLLLNSHQRISRSEIWRLIALAAGMLIGNPFGHASGAVIGGFIGWLLLRHRRRSSEGVAA